MPNLRAMGNMMGANNNTAGKPSNKQPKIKKITMVTAMKPIQPPGKVVMNADNCCTTPLCVIDQAIAEDEDAAASVGIHVTRTKLRITLLSAAMTTFGGVLYAQYQLYVNPETVSGIGISLQMVFGVIAGGLFVLLGPTFGAVFLLALQESLRVLIGNQVHGLDLLIYGGLLVFFIIRMPRGILGTWLERIKDGRQELRS